MWRSLWRDEFIRSEFGCWLASNRHGTVRLLRHRNLSYVPKFLESGNVSGDDRSNLLSSGRQPPPPAGLAASPSEPNTAGRLENSVIADAAIFPSGLNQLAWGEPVENSLSGSESSPLRSR